MIVSRTSSENIERESLPAHVELCSQRVGHINNRILDIEINQREYNEKFASLRLLIIKSISTATAVITASVSLLIIVLDRIH